MEIGLSLLGAVLLSVLFTAVTVALLAFTWGLFFDVGPARMWIDYSVLLVTVAMGVVTFCFDWMTVSQIFHYFR